MRLRAKSESAQDDYPAADSSALADREQIGGLLRDAGVLSDADVQKVLRRQDETGELFGEAAAGLGLATDEQVRAAVSRQQSFFTVSPDAGVVDPLVVTAFDPDDPLSREVRRLRGEIARGAAEGRTVRSVSLFGFDANPERSLVAANLGVAFAQAGYRTLLVDAVLEEPSLHALIRQPNRVGVSTFLSSDVEADAVIQSTAVPGLALMTAGPAVPNVSELFDRQRLFRRLRPLTEAYDMVLVDVGGDSALSASDGGDAALMFVRRGESAMRDVRRVAAAIGERGTMLLGSVIVD